MDKQMSTGTMAAIIAAVVVVLGLIAWRVFGSSAPNPQQQQDVQRQIQQDYMRRMPPGPGQGAAIPGAPGQGGR